MQEGFLGFTLFIIIPKDVYLYCLLTLLPQHVHQQNAV